MTVVAKKPGQELTYAGADTVVEAADLVIVAGLPRDVERFSELD